MWNVLLLIGFFALLLLMLGWFAYDMGSSFKLLDEMRREQDEWAKKMGLKRRDRE